MSQLASADIHRVTTLGGTQLERKDTAGDPERVMNVHDLVPYPKVFKLSSGGGVSNYFEMPEYQKCAVSRTEGRRVICTVRLFCGLSNPGTPTMDIQDMLTLSSIFLG